MEEITLGILFIIFLIIVSIWEMIWKGIGLWKSAKKGSLAWFICIFIFNTVGILPILYIYIFSKEKIAKKVAKKKNKRR